MSEEVAAAATDAAATGAAGDASELYGFTALINNGTLITYVVLGLLVLMSLVSWYITFTKYWDQYRLNKAVKNVEKNFWAAGSVREGV